MSYAMLCQPTHQTVGRPVYPLSLDYPTPPFCLSQRSLEQVNTTIFNSRRVYTCTFKIFTYFLHMDLDTHKTSQNQSNQFGWERNFWKSCSCLVRLHNNAVSLTNERRHINNFIRGTGFNLGKTSCCICCGENFTATPVNCQNVVCWQMYMAGILYEEQN